MMEMYVLPWHHSPKAKDPKLILSLTEASNGRLYLTFLLSEAAFMKELHYVLSFLLLYKDSRIKAKN